MTKVKVVVLNAVVDGARTGDEIQIDERSAKHLASIGYVKIVKVLEEKKAEKVAESAPKPSSTPNKARREQTKAPAKK